MQTAPFKTLQYKLTDDDIAKTLQYRGGVFRAVAYVFMIILLFLLLQFVRGDKLQNDFPFAYDANGIKMWALLFVCAIGAIIISFLINIISKIIAKNYNYQKDEIILRIFPDYLEKEVGGIVTRQEYNNIDMRVIGKYIMLCIGPNCEIIPQRAFENRSELIGTAFKIGVFIRKAKKQKILNKNNGQMT